MDTNSVSMFRIRRRGKVAVPPPSAPFLGKQRMYWKPPGDFHLHHIAMNSFTQPPLSVILGTEYASLIHSIVGGNGE